MGVVLDTNVFVRWERNAVQATDWIRDENDVFISVITASELLVGVHRANSTRRRSRRAAFVEAVIHRFPMLDFTLEIARTHADIHGLLLASGRMIGAHDLIIAATALANRYRVLTSDVDEFRRVPGLEVSPFP